ncbi:MAG: LeuA family protein [Candidatus Helarchaeota archaeon]
MPKLSMKRFLKLMPENYREAYEKGEIHNYNLEIDEVREKFNFAPSIVISDTTCRDGEQQPGVIFTPEQKVDIVNALADVGISLIEIGYPGVSEDEIKSCQMITANAPRAICFVMARANKRDIDAAMKADAKMLDLFTSCSEFHIRTKMGLTPESNIELYMEMLDYAVDHGFKIVFGMEDISRSNLDYYADIIVAARKRAGDAWAGTGISDTTGIFTPTSAKWFYLEAKKKLAERGFPDFALGMHFHNDHGLATANSLACLEVGASAIQGTVLGIGERCGNTPIEEVVVALRTLYGVKLRIKYDKLQELCEMVSKYAGLPIPANKPIVGLNAFRHESGIHAHGVLSHPHIYEMIPHDLLGRKSEFAFGKFSGTAVVLEECLKPHGINPNKEQLYQITLKVKARHEELDKENQKRKQEFVEGYNKYIRSMALSMEEVIEIANEVMNKK